MTPANSDHEQAAVTWESLTPDEQNSLTYVYKGGHIDAIMLARLHRKGLINVDASEGTTATELGKQVLLASAPVSTSARAEVITAAEFVRDRYAAKIERGECVVTFGASKAKIKNIEPREDKYPYKFMAYEVDGESWRCSPTLQFDVTWLPVPTASDEGEAGILLTAGETLEMKIIRLQKERDQAYEDLTKTINQFDLELTGRLAELQECRRQKGEAKAENTELRQQLANAEAANGALKDTLKDILAGVEGNRGNCQDCDSVAIVATAGLQATTTGSASAASADDFAQGFADGVNEALTNKKAEDGSAS